MIKVKRNINGNVLVANVENYMKEQANALLDIIIKIDGLKNNFKIQIGFTIFTLSNVNEELIILAPDYNKNPFIDTICLLQNRNTQYCKVIYTVLQRKYNQYITLFFFIKPYISMLLNVLLFIYSLCNIVYF